MPKATLILEDREDGIQYELTFEPELTNEQIAGKEDVSSAVSIAVNLYTGLEKWFELKGLSAVEDEPEEEETPTIH